MDLIRKLGFRVQLPRDVYVAPFLSEAGKPMLIAIDSAGRLVAEREVASSGVALAADRSLRADLDRIDPLVAPLPLDEDPYSLGRTEAQMQPRLVG